MTQRSTEVLIADLDQLIAEHRQECERAPELCGTGVLLQDVRDRLQHFDHGIKDGLRRYSDELAERDVEAIPKADLLEVLRALVP